MEGEILISGFNGVAVTNHAVYKISQKMNAEKTSLMRTYSLECQKPFTYKGEMNLNDYVEGLFRFEVEEKEEVRYFTGIIVSLSVGMIKIRLSGELKEPTNINEFLNNLEKT